MAIIVILLATTPALAWNNRHEHNGHHDNREWNHQRHDQYRGDRHHNNDNDELLNFLGGLALGAIIQPGYGEYYPPPQPTLCFIKVSGEWRMDRFGNQYWNDYGYTRKVEVPCR